MHEILNHFVPSKRFLLFAVNSRDFEQLTELNCQFDWHVFDIRQLLPISLCTRGLLTLKTFCQA